MIAIKQNRRSFLVGLGSIYASRLLAQVCRPAQAAARPGYVLGATEGEHLIHFSRPWQHLHQDWPSNRLRRSRFGDPASDARRGRSDPPTSPDGRSLLTSWKAAEFSPSTMYRTL